jgi:hypothetical protein
MLLTIPLSVAVLDWGLSEALPITNRLFFAKASMASEALVAESLRC